MVGSIWGNRHFRATTEINTHSYKSGIPVIQRPHHPIPIGMPEETLDRAEQR